MACCSNPNQPGATEAATGTDHHPRQHPPARPLAHPPGRSGGGAPGRGESASV